MKNLQMNGVVCFSYGDSAVFSKTLVRTITHFTLHLKVRTSGNLMLFEQTNFFFSPPNQKFVSRKSFAKFRICDVSKSKALDTREAFRCSEKTPQAVVRLTT
jgi:hypothetical protein